MRYRIGGEHERSWASLEVPGRGFPDATPDPISLAFDDGIALYATARRALAVYGPPRDEQCAAPKATGSVCLVRADDGLRFQSR